MLPRNLYPANQSLLSKEERHAEMLKRLRADEAQKARNILANASSQFQAFKIMKAKFESQIKKEELSAATAMSSSLSAAKTASLPSFPQKKRLQNA